MVTTVATTTDIVNTNGDEVLTAVTSTGTRWVTFHDRNSATWKFYYSDDGVTWTENTSAAVPCSWPPGPASFCIDFNDRAWFVRSEYNAFQGTQQGLLYYTNAVSFGPTTSLSTTGALFDSVIDIDIVAYRDGTTSNTLVAIAQSYDNGGTQQARFWVYSAASGIVFQHNIISGIGGGGVALDFRHTGDSKTVASSTPDVYMTWSDVDQSVGDPIGVYFLKFHYNPAVGARYNTPSGLAVRQISADYVRYKRLSGRFNGSSFVMGWSDGISGLAVDAAERDAGDSITTGLTPPALNDGEVTSIALTYNGNEDILLYAVGTTSDDVRQVVYERSSGTWGAWEVFATTFAIADSMSVQRGYEAEGVGVVWKANSSTPYAISYSLDSFNDAPTAPTLVAPADLAEVPAADPLLYDWDFNDPNPGDTQSEFALVRRKVAR